MSDNKFIKNYSKKKTTKKTADPEKTRYLQVRLPLKDALNFKHTAEMEGMNVQQALINAINLQMKEWGLPPCGNPLTTRPKK